MLRTLKALFEDRVARFAADDGGADALPLAVAALLCEIARADHEVDEDERHAICAAVGRLCEVSGDELEALLQSADEAVDEAVSLYDFTSIINERLDRERKYALLLMLWRVAHADGRIDSYEEYYIRKIVDLLHLSQRDFIRAKHEAS